MAANVVSTTHKPSYYVFLDEEWVFTDPMKTYKLVERKDYDLSYEGLNQTRLRAERFYFIQPALKYFETFAQNMAKIATLNIVLYGDRCYRTSLEAVKDTLFDNTSFKDLIVDIVPFSVSREFFPEDLEITSSRGIYHAGRRIDAYVRQHWEKIDSFVILGNFDREISARYKERFVQTMYVRQLSNSDVALARWILTTFPFSPEQFPLDETVEMNLLKQKQANLEERRREAFKEVDRAMVKDPELSYKELTAWIWREHRAAPEVWCLIS